MPGAERHPVSALQTAKRPHSPFSVFSSFLALTPEVSLGGSPPCLGRSHQHKHRPPCTEVSHCGHRIPNVISQPERPPSHRINFPLMEFLSRGFHREEGVLPRVQCTSGGGSLFVQQCFILCNPELNAYMCIYESYNQAIVKQPVP